MPDGLAWLAASQPEDRQAGHRLGWVTQVSPLQVRLDGDPVGVTLSPQSFVAGLYEGQRCLVQISGKWVVVVAAEPRPPVKVTGSAVFTAAAGWSLGAADTTATVTRPAPAHLTILVGNVNPIGAATLFNVGTVNVGWRPESEESLAFKGSGTNKATASVAPDGVLWLQVMDACPAGYGWRFSGSWYLP